MPFRDSGYTTIGRLQEVLALIQLSGYGTEPGYTPRMICDTLKDVDGDGKPTEERMRHWEQVARARPEFFRVSGKSAVITLFARFVSGSDAASRNLATDVVRLLMETAVDIHDREARRGERWTLYVPLLIAVIGVLGSVATAVISLWLAKS
jgi:hypothetical protein